MQQAAFDANPKDALDAGALHPARRAGVPCPAAAPDVAGGGVDIGRDHIGFHLIAIHVGACAGVVDRVEQAEQGGGLVTFSQARESHYGPQGGVGVLPAVLAQARRIALDIARVRRRMIERRREQQGQSVVWQNQFAIDGLHGLRRAGRPRSAGQHRPRLGDGVDAALLAGRRAERGAIVEPPSPIPVAIPGLAFEGAVQRLDVRPPLCNSRMIAAVLRDVCEVAQRRVQEPAEPDALTLTALTDPVHAVVPIAAAH